MSITKDTLQKHLTDPAVFCCRRAKGTVIGADDRPLGPAAAENGRICKVFL